MYGPAVRCKRTSGPASPVAAGLRASSTLALYETTCLGALYEQSDEGVVTPGEPQRRTGAAIRARPAGLLSVSGRIKNRTRVRPWRSKAPHLGPSPLTERPMSTT